MNPADVHDPWALLLLVLGAMGLGLRMVWASQQRREAAQISAMDELVKRTGAAFDRTANDTAKGMVEIVGAIHANERAAVTRDKDKSSELHEMEQRLRHDFYQALKDDGTRTREMIRSLRVDVLQSKRVESIETAIVDALNDSQDPVPIMPREAPDHA